MAGEPEFHQDLESQRIDELFETDVWPYFDLALILLQRNHTTGGVSDVLI